MHEPGRDVVAARLRRIARPPAALLTLAIVLAVAAFRAEGNPQLRPWPVLVLWLASMAAFLAGAAALRPSSALVLSRMRLSRTELVVLLALTAGAVLARTIALGRIPANFSGDEGEMGKFARNVLEGRWDDPFTTGWLSHPTLWFYLQALSLKAFGDGVVGLRLLTALIGAATVAALYVFARRWYGSRVALMASALLAAYHFHVHFSRIGLNNATDPLFMLVSLGFALAGWESRSPLLLAAAGVSLGVAQSFYFGARLGAVVLIAFLVHQLLVSRAAVLAVARYLPLTVLGFFIAVAPGLRVPLYHWEDYNARLHIIGIFQSGWFDERVELGESPLHILWGQIVDSAGAVTSVSDRAFQYGPGMPLLDPVSSVLFLAGLALVVYRWRRAESALLLAWLIGALLFGGVLIVNTPESHHFVMLAPLLCLLMALGLDVISRGLVLADPATRRIAPALAVLAVAALAAWNLHFYFGDYSHRNTYGGRSTESATAIGSYLAARPGRFVYFVGPPFAYLGNGSIAFLARNPPGIDVPIPIGRAGLPPPPAGVEPLVVFYPSRAGEAASLSRRYPGTPVRVFRSEVDGTPLFAAYTPSLEGWR